LFDGRFRASVDKGVKPFGTALNRTGLSPDHLTALGLFMAVPAAIAIGTGRLFLGLVLLAASAVPDLLDGALAKASGTSSKRGAFFDSVADRVTDALILGGLGWYLQTQRHGHAALLPFAILAASSLISYERAKAESLGFSAKGGLMERAERIVLLCIGLFAPVILVPLLWTMLALTLVTAGQRFVKVWRQATLVAACDAGGSPDGPSQVIAERPIPAVGTAPATPATPATPAAPARPATEPVPAGERWRAWREATLHEVGTSRPDRFAHGSRRSDRSERRRQARVDRLSSTEGAVPLWGRRSGSRRP
jgi:CDP-diacylglycerol--glycerol-3-phosphate 3-phosphatidyltransferase